MRTKLDILPPLSDDGQYDHMRAKVAPIQEKNVPYTNKRRGAKSINVTVGASVRVCKPFHVGKGEMQYSTPFLVQQQSGQSSFILNDGKRCNAAHLLLCPESSQETSRDETGRKDAS
ncbi:hypothetical protein CHARACLAT_027714 [Characodon lateralis]|uniref:Uncharacterized protein n=1 Tax=Characodon lateralis TaxID=208331 RepID=A0ABU7E441_9TELE|nr:hypothetical protein [Characodon lateralis]